MHELEHELKSLVEGVHQLLCESGRLPGETKAREIVAQTRATIFAVDLGPIEANADKVATLKAQVEDCERQIASLGHERTLHAVA